MSHQSEEVRQILHDIKHCSPDELLSLHGIEITEQQTVIDHTYDLRYNSVGDWLAVLDADGSDGFEKFSQYDDEEY